MKHSFNGTEPQFEAGLGHSVKQEHIPVRCAPPACKPYVLQWLPPDVTRGGEGSSSEQVWVGPQWWSPDISSGRGSPRSDVGAVHWSPRPDVGAVHWSPRHQGLWSLESPLWTETHDWKHYLPATLRWRAVIRVVVLNWCVTNIRKKPSSGERVISATTRWLEMEGQCLVNNFGLRC